MGFQNTVVVEVLVRHRFDVQRHLQTERELPAQFQKNIISLVLPIPFKRIHLPLQKNQTKMTEPVWIVCLVRPHFFWSHDSLLEQDTIDMDHVKWSMNPFLAQIIIFPLTFRFFLRFFHFLLFEKVKFSLNFGRKSFFLHTK